MRPSKPGKTAPQAADQPARMTVGTFKKRECGFAEKVTLVVVTVQTRVVCTWGRLAPGESTQDIQVAPLKVRLRAERSEKCISSKSYRRVTYSCLEKDVGSGKDAKGSVQGDAAVLDFWNNRIQSAASLQAAPQKS